MSSLIPNFIPNRLHAGRSSSYLKTNPKRRTFILQEATNTQVRLQAFTHPMNELHLIVLSVWKPLYGPLSDWPLSVCDSRSLSTSRDCIATDVVERVGFTENYQIYYHEDMQFCYLSGQLANEMMLFRQTDTEEGYEQGMLRTLELSSIIYELYRSGRRTFG